MVHDLVMWSGIAGYGRYFPNTDWQRQQERENAVESLTPEDIAALIARRLKQLKEDAERAGKELREINAKIKKWEKLAASLYKTETLISSPGTETRRDDV